MAFSGNHSLSVLRTKDAGAARARILDAARKARGNLTEAARKLGVTRRTLSRWLGKDAELAGQIRELQSMLGREGDLDAGRSQETGKNP